MSTQTTSVSTQTELTWPLSSKLPTMIPRTSQNGDRAKTTVSSQTTPTTSDHNLNPENIKTTKPPQHHKDKTGSIIQPSQHHKDRTESKTKLSQRDKDKPDSTKLPPNKPAIPKQTKKLKQLYADRIKKSDINPLQNNQYNVLNQILADDRMDYDDLDRDRHQTGSSPK